MEENSIFRVEMSKNTDVHTRMHTFYNLVQKVNPEENSVFIKKGVVHTRDTTPGCTPGQKMNTEQTHDF